MSDYPTKSLDLAVVHGLSQGMYDSGKLFEHTRTLWRRNAFRNLAVVGGDGTGAGNTPNAWIGPGAIIENLEKVGFAIQEISMTDPIVHSKAEALAILKMAREDGWKSVGSISVSYHGGRMFPYMVAAMQEAAAEGKPWWIDYRMLPPSTTDSWMDILGSQGLKQTTCIEAAMEDAVKIERQQTQRDKVTNNIIAASFQDTLYYMQHRERIVRNQSWD